MELLLLTTETDPVAVMPAVALLPVQIKTAPPAAAALVSSGPFDLLLVDARHDLVGSRAVGGRGKWLTMVALYGSHLHPGSEGSSTAQSRRRRRKRQIARPM